LLLRCGDEEGLVLQCGGCYDDNKGGEGRQRYARHDLICYFRFNHVVLRIVAIRFNQYVRFIHIVSEIVMSYVLKLNMKLPNYSTSATPPLSHGGHVTMALLLIGYTTTEKGVF
jgi:hypothetical protein